MDARNRFDSPGTHALLRLEAGVGLALVVGLALAHLGEIRWGPFILLFAWIDLVGYVPGAIAYRRAPDGRISRVYHALYNTTHSFATQAAVAGLWAVCVAPEWALLAIPIHLLGDRALFGNFFKPAVVPFEPRLLPEFAEMESRLEVGT